MRFMHLALAEAELAAKIGEVPVGAVIVSGSEILASTHNLREARGLTTAHAEMLALESYNRQSGSWRLPPESEIFVTAEPCLMCTGALLQGRIGKIYYGCDDTKNAGLRNVLSLILEGRFDHIPKVIEGGILEKECGEILSRFFENRRASAVSKGVLPPRAYTHPENSPLHPNKQSGRV